jgi:hypothetical protein
MYCPSCEVQTEFIYVTSGTRPRVDEALSGDWLNDIVTLRSSTSLFLPGLVQDGVLSRLRRTCKTLLISFVVWDTIVPWRPQDGAVFESIFLLLTASGVTFIYNKYIKTRVIECNVVSKLQRNRCITFVDLRSWTNEHLHFYIYIYIDVEESRPPLWSSGQSSCLHIQRPGFDSRPYQIFWEVVGLEFGPLSLVSTIEELLERKVRLLSRKPRIRP